MEAHVNYEFNIDLSDKSDDEFCRIVQNYSYIKDLEESMRNKERSKANKK